jgi:hypothetical protein
MKIEVKVDFTEVDQILFDAGLEIFHEDTEYKVAEYVV